MDYAVFGSPSQTVTVLRCMKMMIFTLGLNVHSSACKFNDFVMNNPDNCSFNHFFFSSILLPSALLSLAMCRLHSSQYSIDNIPLFLRKNQQSDGLQCSQGCNLYLLSKEIQIKNACK